MPTILPVESDIDVAVSRAVAARRDRHRPHIFLNDMDEPMLNALVVGVAAPLSQGEDGWWVVGYVLDGIAMEAFEVSLLPGCGGIAGIDVSALIYERQGLS